MSNNHKWVWHTYDALVWDKKFFQNGGYWKCESCLISHYAKEKPRGRKMHRMYGLPLNCSETLISQVMES